MRLQVLQPLRSMPAQYLLRFDDLCPTMSRESWRPFVDLIVRYELKPILAVVPDNHDPDLKIDDPDPHFWETMLSLEDAGATIAMHGYRHLCRSSGKSILKLHRISEFAGVDEPTQRQWIREGLAILRGHGLSPRLFVAPRHGFDRATLRALVSEGLGIISDGFALRPFARDNVLWIPQQVWDPVQRDFGLWTICIHSNTAPATLVERLDSFLQGASDRFVSVAEVLKNYEAAELNWAEKFEERLALLRIRLRSIR
jgi:Uncharacterized protein conserved in bacteria (DUF2334)